MPLRLTCSQSPGISPFPRVDFDRRVGRTRTSGHLDNIEALPAVADQYAFRAVAAVDQFGKHAVELINGWLVQGVDIHKDAERWANNRTLVPDPTSNYRALAPEGPPLLWLYEVPAGLATIDLFREIANPEIGSGGKIRTPGLQVMSLTSYHCSTPLESFVAPFPAHCQARSVKTDQRRFTPKDSANG